MAEREEPQYAKISIYCNPLTEWKVEGLPDINDRLH
jgi:hypothetical protein